MGAFATWTASNTELSIRCYSNLLFIYTNTYYNCGRNGYTSSSGRSTTAAAVGVPVAGGGAGSLHGPCYHFFYFALAINLHLYSIYFLASMYQPSLPNAMLNAWAPGLSSGFQNPGLKPFGRQSLIVRAQFGCLSLELWASVGNTGKELST